MDFARFKFIFAMSLAIEGVIMVIYLMSRYSIGVRTTVDLMAINSSLSDRHVETASRAEATYTTTADNTTATIAQVSKWLPTTTLEVFQQIDHTQSWMYSAFYDHVAAQEGRPMVRLFGVVKEGVSRAVYCTFFSEGRSLTVSADITKLPDYHNVNYIPSDVECPLPSDMRPTHVSLSFQTNQTQTNRFQILYPGPRLRNVTVCYSILHSGFNKATQLIESMVMNQILGAEHFVVYNFSISTEIDQILRRYQDDGLFTVLQWQVPTQESWYFAQMSALNDCFYRNRNTSRFVVVVDTDEQFVLKNHSTFMELINYVSPQDLDVSALMNSLDTSNRNYRNISTNMGTSNNLTVCFIVRSSRFSNDLKPNWSLLPSQFVFEKGERVNITKYWMLTLTQYFRSGYIYFHEVQSKYLARPELVHTCGMHLIWKFTKPNKCLNVNENLSLVHHYRTSNAKERNLVFDADILKFKNLLYPRVMEQIKKFPKIFK